MDDISRQIAKGHLQNKVLLQVCKARGGEASANRPQLLAGAYSHGSRCTWNIHHHYPRRGCFYQRDQIRPFATVWATLDFSFGQIDVILIVAGILILAKIGRLYKVTGVTENRHSFKVFWRLFGQSIWSRWLLPC